MNPDNEITNDRYFVMINEAEVDEEGVLVDDIADEKMWEKPNPITIHSDEVKESIRDELKVAQDKPEKMRDFMTKTLNVWVNQRAAGYMNLAKWKLCAASAANPMPDITGLEVTCGFDLSATIDLTNVGFEIPLHDDRVAVFSHSFIPENTLAVKRKSDKVPYDLWVERGFLTATPGDEVDYKFMMAYVAEFISKWQLREKELCFDKYLALMLMQDLGNDGHTVIDIPQGIPTLSEPTKNFRAKVYNKTLIHEDNPVLNWAMGNAVVRKDHNDNIMLDKSKATQRIDPVASLMNSHVRVWRKLKPTCPYGEGRGIIML